MATSGKQTALGQLGQEATCPLCLDLFEQPMVLSCGHNFCHDCLAQLGAEFSCPQCRAKVGRDSACPNQPLANIVCHLKRLWLSGGAQEEGSRRQLCQEHGQPLQTFCSSEKSLLCPGCLKGHQDHPLLSLPEAAQEYKDLLDGLLEPLRKEGQKLLEQRQAEEQSRQECQEQFASEKQKVGLALESLQELLRGGQSVWLAWLAEQEEKMEAEWGVALAQLSGEASRLQQLMAQTERKCRQPDGEFLQDIQDTVDRCRSYVVGRVERVSPRLQDRHRTFLEKNASVRLVVDNSKASLQKTLTRGNLDRLLATVPVPQAPQTPRSSKVYVMPNNATAHPRLWCQGSTVTWANTYQQCPDVPERFDQELCVLGNGIFTTGWNCWEVTVQEPDNVPVWDRPCWAIGVAKESVRRKGGFQLSPQEGIWAVGKSAGGEMVAFSKSPQKLSLRCPLRRLRVRLGYEAETVEFLDAETETFLHRFQTGPFLGETLRPFFYLGQERFTLQCEPYPQPPQGPVHFSFYR
ncbi:zinc finger protein RFP-like isoform X1 [Pantherophis guttatus]|nr:zinc finger protein RFP-like isoform X1 [Pantherophis guttatus]XP_060546150.1 zinc finger protein RFP-like isoform X1 [Pantherophis guttatus]XP_060546152.1 zinc finger protein RFP-like isoform X1 [Pantherophis guttatus]